MGTVGISFESVCRTVGEDGEGFGIGGDGNGNGLQ